MTRKKDRNVAERWHEDEEVRSDYESSLPRQPGIAVPRNRPLPLPRTKPHEPGILVVQPTGKPKRNRPPPSARRKLRDVTPLVVAGIEQHVSRVGDVDDVDGRAEVVGDDTVEPSAARIELDDEVRDVDLRAVNEPARDGSGSVELRDDV